VNPHQLLTHAGRLARSRNRDSLQADLRRAVSAAYYALFHLLTQDASRRFTGRADLQPLVARKFDHGQVKQTAVQFARWREPPNTPFGRAVPLVPDDLRAVADAIQELQPARHQADYDPRPEADFTRGAVLEWVVMARSAFEAWERVRSDAAADAFLLALLFRDFGTR
jgi:hypothetical protein